MRDGLSVYLAGPITGLTYASGAEWRSAATRLLNEKGIAAFSPLRAKNYLADSGVLRDSYDNVNPLSTGKGIVTRDRNDCLQSDVVIAYLLGADSVSIGTVMECAWADAARVPLIVVMENDNLHNHAMIREVAGYVVTSLEEAVAIAVALITP